MPIVIRGSNQIKVGTVTEDRLHPLVQNKISTYAGNMDQDVATTDNVTFNQVTSSSTIFVGEDDSSNGIIHVYGAGTSNNEGGELRLYLAADYDGTVNLYGIDSWQHDLRIFSSPGGVFLRYESDNDVIKLGEGATPVVIGSSISSVGILTVDQSNTTGATPVLALDQADISEEFIRLVGQAAVSNITQSLIDEASVSTATREGFLKIYVQDDGNQLTDQAYFVPFFTLT